MPLTDFDFAPSPSSEAKRPEKSRCSIRDAEAASALDENVTFLPAKPCEDAVGQTTNDCISTTNNHDHRSSRGEDNVSENSERPVASSASAEDPLSPAKGASSNKRNSDDDDGMNGEEEHADDSGVTDQLESSPSRRSGLRDRSKLNKPTTWSDELADFSQPDILSGNYTIKDGLVYNKAGHVLMTAERFLTLSSNSNSPRRPMRRARNRVEIEEHQRKIAESSAKQQQAEERRLRKEELENSRKEREQIMLEREKLKLEQLKLKEQDRLRREAEKTAKLIQTEESSKKKKEEQERKQKEKSQREEEENKKRAEKDKVKLAEQEAVRKQQQILQAFVKKLPSQPLSQPKSTSALNFSTNAGADGAPDLEADDAEIVPIGFFHHSDTAASVNKQSTYLGPFFDVKRQTLMPKPAQDDFVSMLAAQCNPSTESAKPAFLDEISAGTRSYASRQPVILRTVRDIDRLPDLLDGFRNKTGVQIEPHQVRMKLFKFFEEYRPGFYGTKLNACSSIITPRDPFRKDTKLLDYNVDSDDEWDLGIEPDMEVDECSDAESTAGDGTSNNKRADAGGNNNGTADDDDEESDEEGFVIRDEDAWKTENALGVSFSNLFGSSNDVSANAALASRFDLSMKYYNSRTKKGKPEKRVPRLMGPYYAEMGQTATELETAGVSMPYFSRLAAISWNDPDTNELGVACRVKQANIQQHSASSSSQPPGSSQSQHVAKPNPAKASRATMAAAVEEEDEAELKVLMQQQRQKLIVDESGNVMLMDTSTSLIASDGVMNVADDDEADDNAEEVERLTAEDKEELVEIYEQCTRQACVARTGSDWQLAQRERRGKLRREAKQLAISRGLKCPQTSGPDTTVDSKVMSWTSSGFGDGNESDDEDFVLGEKDTEDDDDDDDESSTVEDDDDESSIDEEKAVTSAVTGAGTPSAAKKREPKLTQQTLSLVKRSTIAQQPQPAPLAVVTEKSPLVVEDDDSVMEVEPNAPPPQASTKSDITKTLPKSEKFIADSATVSNNNSPLRGGGRKAPRKSESDDANNLDVVDVGEKVDKPSVGKNTDTAVAEAEPKPKRRRIQLNKVG